MASASRRRMWQIQTSRLSASAALQSKETTAVRERLARQLLLTLAVPGHGDDQAGGGPHDPGRFPFHHGDRTVQPAQAILGQALGEQKVAVNPGRRRSPGGHRAVGEGGRLSQLVLRGRQEQAGPADGLGEVGVGGRAEAVEQGPAGAAVLFLLAEKQAQLRVAEPGVMLRRVGVDCLSPGGLRLFPSSPPKQDASQGVLDRPVRRVQPEHLLEVIVGLVQPALGSQGVAEIEMGPGVVGVELERPSGSSRSPRPVGPGLAGQGRDCCGPWRSWGRAGGPSGSSRSPHPGHSWSLRASPTAQ